MSRHDTDDGMVELREIEGSVHTPLHRFATEKPRLLRILTDRIVHESAHQGRAMTTHFGSSS